MMASVRELLVLEGLLDYLEAHIPEVRSHTERDLLIEGLLTIRKLKIHLAIETTNQIVGGEGCPN